MASGDTKTEALLNILGNGGTGDEFRGCCNTKTQNYILDAIDRINALDPSSGGAFKALSASDVTGKDPDGNDIIELWKLPTGIYTFDIGEDDGYYIVANTLYDEETDTYNPDWNFSGTGIVEISSPDSDSGRAFYTVLASDGGVTAFYSADEFGFVNFDSIYPASSTFSGADSSTDGIAGLVPAPTMADTDKFLKSDGTWQPAVTTVSLEITGTSGSDVNVTASEYLDDLVTKIDSGVECVFKLTVPPNSGLPLSGTFLFRVSNYFPDGSNIWCFSPFYDNLSNAMYMLKLEFVPVNLDFHTQNAIVHIFMT